MAPEADRFSYNIRNFGRWVACAIGFLSIWFACIFFGFVIPMETFDHGDVVSAAWAGILATLGAVIGPVLAFFVIRYISRRVF
jgi:hypothetical protein